MLSSHQFHGRIGVDQYILAPYVKVFRAEDAAYVGVGSSQRRIEDPRVLEAYVRTLHYVREPRELPAIRAFVDRLDLDLRDRAGLEHFLFSGGTLIKSGLIDRSERFSRHRLFYNLVGGDPEACQQKLEEASVLVLGCGGIGTMVSTLLVAAGIRRLTLLDRDTVEESNLTRQVVFNERDVGRPKVEVLARKLRDLDSTVRLSLREEKVSAGTARNVVAGHDVAVLSADYPFGIARIVNRAAIAERVPFVNAGYIGDVATVGPFVVPGQYACLDCSTSASGRLGGDELEPLIQDIHENHQAASFGPINAIASSMAVNDVIRFLTRIGPPLSANKRIGFFANSGSVEQHSYVRSLTCATCGAADQKTQK